MKSYINDLFKYIASYESNDPQFETEGFLQTYSGIVTVFQTLRQDRNQAVEIDYYFLDKVKAQPLTTSDLRQLTVQVLITRFEAEVDTDGRSNAAYSYCRNQRSVKQDVPFFENNLAPLLFKQGALKDNDRINIFLMDEMAGYINNFGKGVQVDITPEQFDGLNHPLKMLELARRRLALGKQLMRDRTTLEFHLQRVGSLGRLGDKGRLYDLYLTKWDYLAKTSVWSRLGGWFNEVGAKCKGAFSSFGYFRLLATQRKLAYLTYVLVIVISLVIAFGVTSMWNSYTDDKLEQYQQRANNLSETGRP